MFEFEFDLNSLELNYSSVDDKRQTLFRFYQQTVDNCFGLCISLSYSDSDTLTGWYLVYGQSTRIKSPDSVCYGFGIKTETEMKPKIRCI